MGTFLHQIASGFATGGIYASLALALVMIYRSTHHINFAQGELAMFSTYIAWALIKAGTPYWIAFFATIIVSFLLGVLVRRFVMNPMNNRPMLAVVAVYIGLLLIVNNAAGWIFTYSLQTFPSPFAELPRIPGGFVSRHELGAAIVTLVILVLVYVFFKYTKIGLAMRAVAFNPVSSKLVGIRTGTMLAMGWGLAAAIGAVAGMMTAPIVFLDPNMMGGVLLYAFAGALVGGISNPWGAVAGGYLVAIIENVAGAYVVGSELRLPLALAIIVCVLFLKPAGLFGQSLVSRV